MKLRTGAFVSIKMVAQGEFTETTGEAAALQLFDNNANQLPDALVAANDRMAVGALNAAAKRGLKVPADISVVGFDDLEAERTNPPLTTIRQPVFEMGYRAAETLVALVREAAIPHEQMFSPELIVRASCQPNQSTTKAETENCGFGSRAFLDPAYPTPDRMVPPLKKVTQDLAPDASFDRTQFNQLLNVLEESARTARAREESLTSSVRDLRMHVVGRVEQALSKANSVRELHSVVQSHLQLLGLNSLTIATVADESGFQGEARLVLDYCVGNKPAIAPIDSWLPSAKIVAAHAQRSSGTLRIVQPLFHENDTRGFLVISGTLLDSSLLNRIGIALSRAIQRIGG